MQGRLENFFISAYTEVVLEIFRKKAQHGSETDAD